MARCYAHVMSDGYAIFNGTSGAPSGHGNEVKRFDWSDTEAGKINATYRDTVQHVVFEATYPAVSDMHSTFANHTALKTADLSALDTSNLSNVRAMFNGCSSLEEVNLYSFTPSKYSHFETIEMFDGCSSLASTSIFLTHECLWSWRIYYDTREQQYISEDRVVQFAPCALRFDSLRNDISEAMDAYRVLWDDDEGRYIGLPTGAMGVYIGTQVLSSNQQYYNNGTSTNQYIYDDTIEAGFYANENLTVPWMSNQYVNEYTVGAFIRLETDYDGDHHGYQFIDNARTQSVWIGAKTKEFTIGDATIPAQVISHYCEFDGLPIMSISADKKDVTIFGEASEGNTDNTLNIKGTLHVDESITTSSVKASEYRNEDNLLIGQIYTASGSNISLTADTSSYKTGCSISVAPGVYIARGQWNFDTRASGSSTYGRRTNIYNSTSSATLANNISVNTARNAQYMEVVAIFKLENQSTIALRGSSSVAGTDSCQMQIIRIA